MESDSDVVPNIPGGMKFGEKTTVSHIFVSISLLTTEPKDDQVVTNETGSGIGRQRDALPLPDLTEMQVLELFSGSSSNIRVNYCT